MNQREIIINIYTCKRKCNTLILDRLTFQGGTDECGEQQQHGPGAGPGQPLPSGAPPPAPPPPLRPVIVLLQPHGVSHPAPRLQSEIRTSVLLSNIKYHNRYTVVLLGILLQINMKRNLEWNYSGLVCLQNFIPRNMFVQTKL